MLALPAGVETEVWSEDACLVCGVYWPASFVHLHVCIYFQRAVFRKLAGIYALRFFRSFYSTEVSECLLPCIW